MNTLFQTPTPPSSVGSQGVDVIALLLLLGGIAGAVTAILSLSKSARDLVRRTIFKRARSYGLLRRLVPGVTVAEFNRLLGDATFQRGLDPTHREHVYVAREYFVRVVTGAEEAVLFFAVTTRRKRFRPPLWGGETSFLSEQRKRAIGETSFEEAVATESIWGLASVLGANHFNYQEAYWFGRPGQYQTYLLAISQAGFVDEETMAAVAEHLGPPRRVGLLGGSRTFEFPNTGELSDTGPLRAKAKPNTYGVVAPNVIGWQDWIEHIGPDPTQVGVLYKKGNR